MAPLFGQARHLRVSASLRWTSPAPCNLIVSYIDSSKSMPNKNVVIVGGGVAGCAAAIAAKKAGLAAVLIERTDLLLAGANRAGKMNFNGKLVGAEECKALGGGEMFAALESLTLHHADLYGEEHGYVYDTVLAEPTVRRMLRDWSVEVRMERRAVDVVKVGNRIISVLLDTKEEVKADAFVDATGTSGGLAVCRKYGRGCVMCGSYRCPVFGDRISIATKAGVREVAQHQPDGSVGLISAAVSVHKSSLEKGLRERLEREGVVLVPLPGHLVDYSKAEKISSVGPREQQRYLNLVNIGPVAKCVKLGYLPLADMRTIPGLENVQIEDPLGGGRFGFIKMVSMAPRDNTLKVPQFDNLFVAGEKCGPIGGINECIVTGVIAGNNAARAAAGAAPLELPPSITVGDFIAVTGENLETEQGLKQGYRMGHGPYLERMKQKGFYSPDPAAAHERIARVGLTGVLARQV